MAWRIHKSTWPNGRAYWTVEDRATNRVRIGQKGGITKYHDREDAVRERKRLNDEYREDFEVIE